MREGLAVFLGVLAITIGAGAPTLIVETIRPGSIAPLNRPSPGSGQAERQHQSNTADDHQDGQPAQTGPTYGVFIQIQQAPRQNAVAPKPEEEGHWYTTPDWWVAGFTGALFIATTGLWWFTARMWWTTRRAVLDGKKALEVAQSNAKAARDSADALPSLERAYVFLLMAPYAADTMRRNMHLEDRRATTYTWQPDVKTVFEFKNYGKTPAIISRMKVEFVSGPDIPSIIEPEEIAEVVIEGGGVYPLHGVLQSAGPDIQLIFRASALLNASGDNPGTVDDELAAQLLEGTTFLWLHGRIIYDDVFGKQKHETSFCWRYDGKGHAFEQYPERNHRT